MDRIQQHVRLTFEYPVIFTTGVFAPANRILRDLLSRTDDPAPADLVVVVDEGVARAHGDLVSQIEQYCRAHGAAMRLAAPVLIVPGGEQVKNAPHYLDLIHEAIHSARLCRHSYVIAVGGGAVLDAVGYATATAHRGIRLVRVPTTVLAQDDSGVGVKNGINGYGTKNYYGTFAPPFAVVNDALFLTTLEDRDWLGGVSEAIKAALIKDGEFFAEIERLAQGLVARDARAMQRVVRRSAALHLEHIATGGDPFEFGSSRPLDFGHWAAHRLEDLTDHRLRHGEAVAIGLALDSTYSWLKGWLGEPDWRRIVDLFVALRLAVYAPELGEHLDSADHPRSVLRGLEQFREHLGGRLTVMLLDRIGHAFDVHEIDTGAMIRSVEVLKRIQAAGSSRAVPGPSVAAASPRGV
jgi:3-dehydroquinate synthase